MILFVSLVAAAVVYAVMLAWRTRPKPPPLNRPISGAGHLGGGPTAGR